MSELMPMAALRWLDGLPVGVPYRADAGSRGGEEKYEALHPQPGQDEQARVVGSSVLKFHSMIGHESNEQMNERKNGGMNDL
jgi:hypothetical protein